MRFCLRFVNCIKVFIAAVVIIAMVHSFAFAQSGNCHPATPFFDVNLSSDPNGVWFSPSVARSNLCCTNTSPDRCIEFEITLSPQAVAINFQIASGAVPPGAMYYQINCGPQVQVGSPICLNGPGPYTLTFCKPGNNPNSYAITSIAAPGGSPDKTVGDGCNTTMSVSGLVTSSISWTSIAPGAVGAYNSYLNCTSACTTATVTPASGHPAFVDYKVCGTPSAGICSSPGQFCDTVRVYMSPPILNTVTPNPAAFCVNNPSVTLTGTVNGGQSPYTYAWTNAANGGGTVVGNGISYTATSTGTYSFIVYDQNYPDCPASIVNVSVTSTPLPVVNAGLDKISCGTSINLSGTVTGASGGIWSGGAGGFMPGNTALTTSYTPTLSELNSGTVVLTLTSTGNGACNAVSDQVTLFVSPPVSATITGPSIICNGQTVSLTANVTGGTGPFTYLWNTGATTQTITTSSAGTYSVTVTGAAPGFCTATETKVLTVNPPIVISTTPNNAVACADSIAISASATGGTGAYTYLWSNGATTSATSVNTGTYTITVTDAVGCSANGSVSVTASSSLAASVNQPAIVCNGASATLTVSASGGLGSYTYLWTNNATTTSITEGAGNYCVTVTDAGGCVTSACATITQNTPITANIPVPASVCNGASATATATVSGGQAPYSFLWNTGQTTQSLTAVAGTYTLTATDLLNCSSNATVTISQATALSITPGTVGVGCFGGSNGSATASVTGGTPSYSYAWSPFGGAAATANGLTAGTYSVTVTDGMGCSASIFMLVSQPLALTATATVNNNVSCFGGSNGSATVSPAGGTSPYSYVWSPGGAVTQTVNTLAAGTYTIEITDDRGCTTSAQATITQPSAALSATDTVTNVSCNGGNNGTATVLASGGTPGYSYLWAPGGATTATVTGLSVGSYTVTVTDLTGCVFPEPVAISEPPILTVSLSNVTNATCNGADDGAATAVPGGGVAPYTYLWTTSPAQTTVTAINMGPGAYTVTVSDANNCNVTSPVANITEPTALNVIASPSTLVSCDTTITITSSASGGTGGYDYLWSTGATTTAINVNTGSYIIVAEDANGCTASDTVGVTASNSTLAVTIAQPPNICNGSTIAINSTVTGGLGGNTYLWSTGATTVSITVPVGSYCVTVTDAGGCIATGCVTVVENPIISMNVGTPPVVCPGDSATVTVSASGGQPPYSYLWNTGETTQSVTKPAGTYTVTLTDVTGIGCAASASVTITEEIPVATTVSHTDVSCYGAANGTVIVYASGGLGGYTYLWAPSGGTGTSIDHLGPATYTVTVTDSLGCIKKDSATVVQPLAPITISVSGTDNQCFGDSTGTALANVGGGSAPYYFLWTITGDTVNAINNLGAGTYIATVSDTSGCYVSDTIIIQQPPELMITATATQFNCFGETGSVSLLASGGTPSYTVSGSDTLNLVAGTYSYMVMDNNGCMDTTQAVINAGPAPFILTATATQIACYGGEGSVSLLLSGGVGTIVLTGDDTTNLVAATYNYTATDSTGCIATAQSIINAAPDSLVFTAIASQINCFGQTGSVQLIASGGTGTLLMSGDDTTNLIAGTYNYIVTDGNGCTDTTQSIINPGPPPFTLTATATTINCYGGTASVNLNAAGGAGILTYSGDDTLNLAAGTYNYTVTDTNGCTATATATVAPGPAAFVLTATPSQISCFGGTGTVNLTLVGGLGNVVITGDDTVNLVAGTYNYTATDSTGCTATAQAVIAPAPDSLTISITTAQISCFGNSDGSAAAVVVGGTSPYQYSWQTGATSLSISGLAAGTYSVGITDDRGCVIVDSTIISEPSELLLSNGAVVASTCGLNNGSATVNASGGTGSYSYSWMPYGGTSAMADSLLADDYTVTVTDSNGCSKQTMFTINSTSFLIADFGATEGCLNSPTAFSDSSVASPGSTITSWEWDFGDSSPLDTVNNTSHIYSGSGSYNVTLTVNSSAGCSSAITLPVLVFSLPTVNFLSTTVCLNSATVFSDLSTVSGDTLIAWLWDFGDMSSASAQQNPMHTYNLSGDFTATLIATSGNGCIDSATGVVTVYANPVVLFTVDDSSGCVVHCPSFTDLTNPTGTTVTAWQWDYGDGSPFGNNASGEHCYTGNGVFSVSLTVTTAQGCSSTGTQNNMITVYQLPQAEFDFSPSSPTTLIAADIDFYNQSTGSLAWDWDFGDMNDTTGSVEQHPEHIYTDTGSYCIRLIAMNNFQCADTVIHCLRIEPEFTFFIPNAFTPFDSPGDNDGFSGYGTNIKEYEMWIFDRWGDMIFHTTDLEMRWNGKANNGKEMAQRDVYVYLVKLVDFRGADHQYRGTVTLVR